MKNIPNILVFLLAAGLAGCGSGADVAGNGSGTVKEDSLGRQTRDAALQYFIDGSLAETKGDYARAILEYQDALRLDRDPAIYFALAKCYLQLGKNTLAVENGREAVRLSPDNMEYRRLLAQALAVSYNLDAAAEQYEEMVRRDSSRVENWHSLARLYRARNPAKALLLLERMRERFGPEWEVLLQLAELYSQKGEFEKSADALRQMLESDPRNGELKRSLAETYVRAQKLDEAQTLYEELVQAYPQNFDILSSCGVVRFLRKDYAGAERIFEDLVDSDSAQIEAKLRVGEAYFGQVEKDSALLPATRRLFERIRDRHPRDWRAYWFLGALGAMGNDDSATVRNFRTVTELSSGNADAWVYLSSVFLEKNNFQEVVSILERAVRIVPDDFRVNFFLGVAYNQLGRNNEAVRALEKARQLNARDVNTLGQLALVYDGLGRHEESDRLYDEALAIEPGNAVILNNYAYSLAERNVRIDRALEMAQKAVDAQPQNASFLDTIGWVFFRLEEYRQAERYLTKAIETGEVSAVVHEHLGDVYYKMKDFERAMKQWKTALKMDESNEILRAKIARGAL